MKKRNCRMTEDERQRHERATKIRKMSDGQLCDYIDALERKAEIPSGLTQNQVIEKFIRALSIRENNSEVRLSDATIRKIKQVALSKGYLRPEQ